MDAKEMNIEIYRAIAAKANELFQRVKISAGTYSAKELAERKRGKECLCWEMKEGYEEITISVESFVCRFIASMVFTVLARFEKLVPTKERIKFTRCEESKRAAVCSFTMTVPKSAIPVAQIINKDYIHKESVRFVFIDVDRKCVVGSDGYRISARGVEIGDVSGEIPTGHIFIEPDKLKQAQGICRVNVFQEEADIYRTEITTERGEILTVSVSDRYPDWRGVTISEQPDAIRIKDTKRFIKLAKLFKKQAGRSFDYSIHLEIHEGEKYATVELFDDFNVFTYGEYRFELCAPAEYTCRIYLSPCLLADLLDKWDGAIHITSVTRIVRIGSTDGESYIQPMGCAGRIEKTSRAKAQPKAGKEPTEKPAEPLQRISPAVSLNQWDSLGKSVLLFCQISGTVSLNQWDCFAASRGRRQIVGTIRPKCYYNSS